MAMGILSKTGTPKTKDFFPEPSPLDFFAPRHTLRSKAKKVNRAGGEKRLGEQKWPVSLTDGSQGNKV
jgi:hypothetical protein